MIGNSVVIEVTHILRGCLNEAGWFFEASFIKVTIFLWTKFVVYTGA